MSIIITTVGSGVEVDCWSYLTVNPTGWTTMAADRLNVGDSE